MELQDWKKKYQELYNHHQTLRKEIEKLKGGSSSSQSAINITTAEKIVEIITVLLDMDFSAITTLQSLQISKQLAQFQSDMLGFVIQIQKKTEHK